MRRIAMLQRHVFLAAAWILSGAAAGRAQNPELAKKINNAIDKGEAIVRQLAIDSGGNTGRTGLCALHGWTLIEADPAGSKEAIAKLAAYVRKQVPTMDQVYDLSLAAIFLDRLQDPGDGPLIESMAVR